MPERRVFARLAFSVDEPAILAFQIAAAAASRRDERLDCTGEEGAPVAVVELPDTGRGRTHLVRAERGGLTVHYAATVPESRPESLAADAEKVGAAIAAHDHDVLEALRPSRYCPSDQLAGFAAAEFAAVRHRHDLGSVVASWVFERLTYDGASTAPLDTAVDTLTKSAGVCRDFAHVTIAVCRALDLPARLVSAYAPGLSPMDFHAVVEVKSTRGWEVLDPTRLAPRTPLVRIATGRDAADTAFVSVIHGKAEMTTVEVGATVAGDLPADDHTDRVMLADAATRGSG